MHKITDEQIDYILDDIKANGVNTEDLQYNLLDHICCIIENEMSDGDDFYKFYEHILPRFFKKELKEIQEETDNLLTFKHYYAMKKTLNISGMAAGILTLLGATFKVMHWPGAGVMIVLGAVFFSLIFLPLMIVLKFRDEEKITDKLVFSYAFLLGITGILGTLFKIMHWPYATVLMITSSSLFIFTYIPLYFLSRYHRAEHRFNTVINTVLMLGFGGMTFALMNVGASQSVSQSVDSSYRFMVNHAMKINDANAEMQKTISDEKAQAFHEQTQALYRHLEETKVYLIAIGNGISKEEARNVGIFDLKNSTAYYSFKDQFEDGKGEYSLATLKQKVETYNQMVATYYPGDQAKQVAFEDLQFDRTVLAMVLYELAQIQWQIANNENCFLTGISTRNTTSMVYAQSNR